MLVDLIYTIQFNQDIKMRSINYVIIALIYFQTTTDSTYARNVLKNWLNPPTSGGPTLSDIISRYEEKAADFSLSATPEEVEKFKAWQASPYYLESFEPNVISMPEGQLTFIRKWVTQFRELYKEILVEAIDRRNDFAPNIRLLVMYGPKLLRMFTEMRREEVKIHPRLEEKPEYFDRSADLIDHNIERSKQIMEEKNYDRYNVDIEKFKRDTNDVIDYWANVIFASPIGGYLKVEPMKALMDDANHPLHGLYMWDVVSDLLAQFRAIGYESTLSIAKRISNLVRGFGKSKLSGESDDADVISGDMIQSRHKSKT